MTDQNDIEGLRARAEAAEKEVERLKATLRLFSDFFDAVELEVIATKATWKHIRCENDNTDPPSG